MVIPAVGAGIIVALVDFALGVLLVAGVLMALGLVYWLLGHARDAVASFPVIGGAASTAITRIIQTTQVLVASYENVIIGNFFWLIRNLRIILNYFLAPLFIPIATTLDGHTNWLSFISNDQLPKLWGNISSISTTLVAHFNWLKFITDDQLPKLWSNISSLTATLEAHTNWLDFISHNQLPALWAEFNAVRADIVLIVTAVRELQAFLPLLRTLAVFETTAVGGITGLRADVDELTNIARWLRRDVDKVLPLSVVTALGLAAVMNLERLARDPCHCLTAGDFSDLPSRVGALEELGP